MYEQPSLLAPGAVPPSLWPGWLADPDTRHRFTAKVHHRSPTACWYYWTAAIGSDGHGRFRAGSRPVGTSRVVTAHLYAYQLEHGLFTERPLTTDLVVRPRCDEASCQNPHHLHLGTAADNSPAGSALRPRFPLLGRAVPNQGRPPLTSFTRAALITDTSD